MVAGKRDDQRRALSKVREPMVLAIDAGKIEIGRRPAEF
jgi:hypothetical protein